MNITVRVPKTSEVFFTITCKPGSGKFYFFTEENEVFYQLETLTNPILLKENTEININVGDENFRVYLMSPNLRVFELPLSSY